HRPLRGMILASPNVPLDPKMSGRYHGLPTTYWVPAVGSQRKRGFHPDRSTSPSAFAFFVVFAVRRVGVSIPRVPVLVRRRPDGSQPDSSGGPGAVQRARARPDA